MKTNLNKKYKDRDPMETVQIITDFFIKEGYNIEIIENEKTKANSFWCRIVLKNQEGKVVLGQNGKGTTLEYSLASGHAELYERYCANFHIQNFYDVYKYLNNNKKDFGYFHEKNEKYLTFEEIQSFSNRVNIAISYLDNSTKNYYLETLALLYNKNKTIPCSYFYNLDPNKSGKYFNEYMLLELTGSDGTAAGNTIEEAITQGLSEVYEHYVSEAIFKDSYIREYYELDLNQIPLSPYLINLIFNIKNQDDIILHIFDLSYNFKMPVILGTLHNKKTNTWSISLGASPIFEIALERVLTEAYQGAYSLDKRLKDTKLLMIPFNNIDNIDVMLKSHFSSVGDSDCLPEQILLRSVKINEYNKNIFLLNQEYTNKELNEYFIKLNKMNNFDIYIKDISKCKEIKAVRVFLANKEVFSFRYKFQKPNSYKDNFDIAQIFLNYLKTDNFNFNKYQNIKQNNTYLEKDPFLRIDISSTQTFYDSLRQFLYFNNEDNNSIEIKKFIYLHDYLLKEKYSLIEINYIFINILLLPPIDNNDLININNIEYWFKKIFLNNF